MSVYDRLCVIMRCVFFFLILFPFFFDLVFGVEGDCDCNFNCVLIGCGDDVFDGDSSNCMANRVNGTLFNDCSLVLFRTKAVVVFADCTFRFLQAVLCWKTCWKNKTLYLSYFLTTFFSSFY
eukprot:737842_1